VKLKIVEEFTNKTIKRKILSMFTRRKENTEKRREKNLFFTFISVEKFKINKR